MRALAVILALLVPTAAVAQDVDPDAFAGATKVDLYRAGQRYRDRWLEAENQKALLRVDLWEAREKLRVRTATVVAASIPPSEGDGMHPVWWVVIGLALFAGGVAAGLAIDGASAAPPVVVNN